MSILSRTPKSIDDLPLDSIYVIYGDAGTGKTVLASSFPKTEEKPMLYLDFLEGGTGSIPAMYRKNIVPVEITKFEQLDEVLTDVDRGYTVDDTGAKIPVAFSTIVFDSATQLEYLVKEYLKEKNNKDSMNLNLWGQAKESQDHLWNMAKYLQKKTGSIIVIICHKKEVTDEQNPGFNKTIPSLMNSAAYALCAKASFVWYTKIEMDSVVDPKTHAVTEVPKFMTYIDAHPYLLTKCRKPVGLSIPNKVTNLTFERFETNVLSKLKGVSSPATSSKKKVATEEASTETASLKTTGE